MGGNAKPDKSYDRLMVCAFLLAAFTLFAGLGRPSLMEPDEERNAEVAREMKESGAWLVPTYNGLPYLDKPAFYFKTVALSFRVFGETAMAARLPSAVFGFGLLVVLFGFCRRVYGNRCASLAVMVVATSPLYVAFARLVIMDMMLAFFLSVAIFAGFLAEEDESRRKRWHLLGAAASGLATLVKGPVGFIQPVLVLCVFHLLDHRPAALKRLFAPLNLIAFFLVVLPWFWGVTRVHPDFAYYGLIEESWHRYTTTSFHRAGPFYYYVPWVLLGSFAWSLLLPESMIIAWKTRARWSRADHLFVVWSVVLLVFFSISKSKRPDYILTVIVALGALIARVFDLALQDAHPQARRLVCRGTMILAAVALVGAGLLAIVLRQPDWLIRLLHENGPPWWLLPVCFPVACGLGLSAMVAVMSRFRKNVKGAFCGFVLLPLTVFATAFPGVSGYAAMKSHKFLSQQIAEYAGDADIVCVQIFPSGLPFYLKHFATLVTNTGREFRSNYIAYELRKTSAWPECVIRSTELDAWIIRQKRPLCFIADDRNALLDIAARYHGSVTKLGKDWWGVLLSGENMRSSN